MRIRSMLKLFSRSAALAAVLTAAACVVPAAPEDTDEAGSGEDDPAAHVTDVAAPAGDDLAAPADLAALPADSTAAGPGGGGPYEPCEYGYYRCPTTGAKFYYEALRCSSGPSSIQAARSCDSACTAVCTNSGWIYP